MSKRALTAPDWLRAPQTRRWEPPRVPDRRQARRREDRSATGRRANAGGFPLPNKDEEVPISFAPVIAGVLAAREIIKEHYFSGHDLEVMSHPSRTSEVA